MELLINGSQKCSGIRKINSIIRTKRSMILLLISRERRILRENRAREQERVYHERIYTIPYQVRRNNIRWRGRNRRKFNGLETSNTEGTEGNTIQVDCEYENKNSYFYFDIK